VARRVEISGAGTRLPAQRLTPERLRTNVREAMARREGARQIAAAFAKAGGPAAAADAVEELLIGLSGGGKQKRLSARAAAG
jgi:UDP:flavonoid glycosyltransferase YjiC (YdhE family)